MFLFFGSSSFGVVLFVGVVFGSLRFCVRVSCLFGWLGCLLGGCLFGVGWVVGCRLCMVRRVGWPGVVFGGFVY